MSSDERIKKLRGSGGYVTARVTDDEQVKGNLGGPDLFLSPIGRLDPAVMSKYYCNTCEKEFEGGPRIEYDNPNEEVAENLILAEKGQYSCHNCTATIAEYRVFRKPNEDAEVGLAKTEAEMSARQQQAPEPAQPQQQAQAPEPAQPQQQAQAPEPAQPQQQAQAPEPAQPQQQAPEPAQPQQQAQAPEPAQPQQQAPEPAAGRQEVQAEAVRPIAGMSVFDENGNVVGTAREVGVAKDRGIVLVVQTPDGSDEAVRWDKIGKIGEIILLKACDDACCAEQAPGATPGCPACGFANGSDAKFCEQCGGKI